ncbi:MAG: FHA domain-containing protein [Candidatus Hydrogenedentes bacterium]|nr:FHA domain-containing protein [Candidatus Hydrogenedentota bacterium]
MSAPDMLEVINGPEDGTEFPISRAPVIIGMDLGCEVNVRLDEGIERFHARLTAVSDGYRVRKIRGGRLCVNGKRAGVLRSRILREGGILEVGNTEFCLKCASDGLAKRSRGLPAESDLVWTIQTFAKRLFGMLRPDARRRRSTFARLLRFVIFLFVAAMVVGYFWPDASAWVQWYIRHYANIIMTQVRAMTGGPF